MPKAICVKSIAAALVLCTGPAASWGATDAASTEPTAAQLRQQMSAMQAKLDAIEARQQAQADSAQTVAEVLKDAKERSALLQSEGVVAGYDKGFFLQSSDGNFKLQPYFEFQFRSVTNYRDNIGNDTNDTQNGFEIRRMRFGLRGTAFSPDLSYNFRVIASRSTGNTVLELAYAQYQFANDFAFRVGQWKENVFHEESVAAIRQTAVDRSLVNALIGGPQTGYVQGVSLVYNPDGPLHAEAALTDGANSDNTDFTEGGGGNARVSNPNYGVTGRAEYKLSGDWTDYADFTGWYDRSDLLVLGAGFDYTEGGDAFALYHTLDVTWKPEAVQGLGVYGAYLGSYNDTGTDTSYDWGFLAQAGYLLTDKFELFGRYDFTRIDTIADNDTFSELTAGMNYYFARHNAKVTIDLSYLPNGSPSNQTGIGVLASDDSQFMIRGQFQLAL